MRIQIYPVPNTVKDMVEDTKEKKEKEQTLAIYNMLQLQNLYI
jgi:hypothetical protein